MTREALADALRDVRGELTRLCADPWSPAVERSLRLADMYLHMALWHLGETDELTPEVSATERGLPPG